ncbi:MAG: element excision factor XisI family protein [Bacteroidota bacterium]
MDRLSKHVEIVKSVISEIYENYIEGIENTEHILIQDEKHNNYLLLMNSWMHGSRFYGILIHMQVVENGLIYLHDDNTDLIVVDQLLEKGIAKKDIVIGWHEPSMRAETEFATA